MCAGNMDAGISPERLWDSVPPEGRGELEYLRACRIHREQCGTGPVSFWRFHWVPLSGDLLLRWYRKRRYYLQRQRQQRGVQPDRNANQPFGCHADTVRERDGRDPSLWRNGNRNQHQGCHAVRGTGDSSHRRHGQCPG